MQLVPTLFSRYELSRVEQISSQLLNPLQKANIQNLIANLAEEKTLLQFTPDNLSPYIQREAELQGQIGILQHLLALNDEAEELLKNPPTEYTDDENQS